MKQANMNNINSGCSGFNFYDLNDLSDFAFLCNSHNKQSDNHTITGTCTPLKHYGLLKGPTLQTYVRSSDIAKKLG